MRKISTLALFLFTLVFLSDADAQSVTAPNPRQFSVSTSGQDASGFQLQGFNSSDILLASVGLRNPPSGTTMSISTTTGLTLSTGYSGWTGFTRRSFTGTMASINAALASLKVSTGATTGAISITVSATVNPTGYYYLPTNGHFYRPITWPSGTSGGASVYSTIKNAAAGTSYKGQAGYLVTITNQDEQDFIQANVPGNNILIALTDEETEGVWKWDTGPEAGTIVRNGTGNISDKFNTWCGGEPNNWGPGEDYTVTKWNGGNCWNDYGPPASNFPAAISGYVIEYGTWADPEDQTFDEFYSASVSNNTNGCPLASTTAFRYIKFEATYSSDDRQVNVHEIYAYSSGTNVALGKTATANGLQTNGASAVDGNRSTRYSSDRANPFTSGSNPVTLIVDLGQDYTIQNIKIDLDCWEVDFKVYVSSDQCSWAQYGSSAVRFKGVWPCPGTGDCTESPTITSFTPTQASNGSSVVITGTNFDNVTSIKFGGTNASSFTINSSTQITAVIGSGSTGKVTVTKGLTGGLSCQIATATSSDNFTYSACSDPGTLSGGQSICVGLTSTLTSTVSGGSWSSSNTSIATVDATSGVVTGVGSGTATISYTVTGGCSVPTRTVTVTAAPSSGSLTGIQSICSNGSSQFTRTGGTSGGSWTSSASGVATVSSTGLVTAVAAGTSTITYTVPGSGGCANVTATRTVTVTAAPNAGTLAGTQGICVNRTTVFSSNGNSGGTWTSSNSSVATIGNVANTSGGVVEWCVIYDYDAVNARYRVGVDSREFIGTGVTPSTVNTLRLFDLWDGPVTYSSYDPNGWAEYYIYTTTPLNYAGSAFAAYLRSANGFYGVRAEFTFNPGALFGVAPGTATITYTVAGTGGCADATATRTVTVTAPPSAGTLAGTQAICVAGTSQFTSNGNTGGSWTSSATGVATVSSTGLVTAVAAGTSTITYTVPGSGGCANVTATRTVTVTAAPNAGTLAGTQAICVAGVSIFTTNGNSGGTWTSSTPGVATVSSSGTVTGVAAGTATITYTVAGTGGCADATATRTVTVTTPPSVGTLSGDQNIFIGATSTFSSTVSGGTWASSNTSVATVNATTGVVTGVAAGTATMTYTFAATGGCSEVSGTRTVVVVACPTIPALSASAYPVCAQSNFTLTAAGLSGLSSLSTGIIFKLSTTELTNPYVGGTVIATVPFASLEAGNTIARTTTSLSAGGTYYIYAILSTTPDGTGCRPFASTTLVVNPVGQVTLPASSVVCSGASIAAQALTTSNTGGTTTYSWTNSATSIGLAASGVTSTIPAFTATNTGATAVTATITVTPTFTAGGLGCPGPAGSYSITVNPIPSVTAISNSVICNGAATTYTLTGPVTAATYNWTNSNTAIGLAGTGSGTIAFTASNTTAAPISSTIAVTPSLTNGGLTCTGGTISFTVTVNPSGQVNAIDNQVLCNGSATSAVTFSTTNNGLISTGGTQLASSGTISVAVPDNSTAGTTHTIPVTLPTGAVITNMRVTMNLTHTFIGDMVINLRAPNGQVLNLFNEHGGGGSNLLNTVISSTGTTALATGTAPFTGTYAAAAAIGVGPTGYSSTAANFASLYSTPNGNWTMALEDVFFGDLGTLTGWSISFDYTVQGQFGTNMNWTNSLSSIGLAATGTGNIPSFTAANTTAAPVVSTVTVTPVYFNSGTSCPGTPATFTYTVNPTPTVSAVANQVFCVGSPSTVNFSGATTGTVYNWTSSNAAIGLATSGTGNLSFTPTNTSNVPIVSTITVTPSYTNAGVTCTGTPRTFTITVNPVGQVNAVLNQLICNGAGTTAVNFATVNGGGTVQVGTPVTVNSGAITVAIPDNNPAGITHSLPVSLPAGATITGISVNFNMTHTFTQDMVINLRAPNGQILNLVNRRGGAGDNFVNTNISSASTNSLAGVSAPFTGTYAADAATGVGPTSFVSTATNFAALYSVANGDWTLGMRDYAFLDFGTLTGWSITFNYTTVAGAVTTYNWTNTTPSIGLAASGVGNIASFAAANTSTVPVTATVSVTPTYTNAGVSCAGPASSFTYTVNPTPTVAAVSSQAVCVGSNVAAVAFVGTVSGTVYNWTNTNTAIGLAASGTGDIPTFVGTNTTSAPISGTITVTPVFTSGGITCNGTPRTFTITVNPIPTVNPVASFPVCHNSTAAVTFSGATTGTVYSWTNSTTSIGLAASGTGNISFTALNTTGAPVVATITVTPRFTNGGTTCTGTPRTFTITVNPLPVVSAGTLPARICISDTLVPLNGTPVGGSWSGIGTSGMNFVPPATAVGTWPITYTFRDLNGCTNSATIAATVLACDERNRDLDNRAVFLYPNPNNGQFNLRINSTRFNVLGMRVFNSAGQLVSTKQWSGLVFARVIPVDLTNLPAGIYMVRLYYGDGMDRGADRTFQIIVAR
jgi:subtilisin-like proprotein convertase family protein/uncharacterized protein YjdB